MGVGGIVKTKKILVTPPSMGKLSPGLVQGKKKKKKKTRTEGHSMPHTVLGMSLHYFNSHIMKKAM